MYIKQLRLCESEPEINTIREISFKMGINLIVDNSTKNINSTIINKGNSVGKTTVLKIIDLCLGSTKKKYIYTDYELGSENINLKTYIFQKKVYAELLVVDNLDSPCIKHLLKVELFRNGKRFIDDIPKSTELYNNELNTIFFNNHCNKPTFRQLIKLFVRIEQTKDNDKFLRYLHTNTTDIQYENIYSYLFRFQSQKISNELLSVKNNIKNFKDALKEQQKINNIKGIDIIDQRLADISQECINIRNRLDNMVDIERLQENSKYIEKIQLQYTSLSDEINLLEFRKNKISKIINNATAELNNRIDIKMLKNLYNETFINFTNINKQFQDLISFNEQLIDNKISYFKNQLNKIDSKLKNSYKSKKNLFNINKDIITLIENNKLEKYYKLQNELEEYTNEKGKLEQIKNIFDTLNQNLVKEENKLKN